MLELTWGARDPYLLPTGEQRRFLEDGDEIILRGGYERDGFRRIGLGECTGTLLGAICLKTLTPITSIANRCAGRKQTTGLSNVDSPVSEHMSRAGFEPATQGLKVPCSARLS